MAFDSEKGRANIPHNDIEPQGRGFRVTVLDFQALKASIASRRSYKLGAERLPAIQAGLNVYQFPIGSERDISLLAVIQKINREGLLYTGEVEEALQAKYGSVEEDTVDPQGLMPKRLLRFVSERGTPLTVVMDLYKDKHFLIAEKVSVEMDDTEDKAFTQTAFDDFTDALTTVVEGLHTGEWKTIGDIELFFDPRDPMTTID